MDTEKVTFLVPQRRYLLHLIPEKKVFRGEILEIMPARLVEFDMGKFETDDPEIIKLIRKSSAYKRNEIKEITDQDKEAVNMAVKQRTVRGSITTQSLNQEAGVKEPQRPISLKEANTQCPECGKVFANDPHQRKVNMHIRRAHQSKKKK